MIVRLKHIDMGILLLHMGVMRQNMRKVLKRNYSKDESKEKLGLFDEIKGAFEFELNHIENIEEDPERIKQFTFDENTIIMLSTFLDTYIEKLTDTLKAAGRIKAEDQAQLDSLNLTKKQLDYLKVIHDVG